MIQEMRTVHDPHPGKPIVHGEIAPAARHVVKFVRQTAQRRAADEGGDREIGDALGVAAVLVVEPALLADARPPGERAVAVEAKHDRRHDPLGAGAGIDLPVGAGLDLARDRLGDVGRRLPRSSPRPARLSSARRGSRADPLEEIGAERERRVRSPVPAAAAGSARAGGVGPRRCGEARRGAERGSGGAAPARASARPEHPRAGRPRAPSPGGGAVEIAGAAAGRGRPRRRTRPPSAAARPAASPAGEAERQRREQGDMPHDRDAEAGCLRPVHHRRSRRRVADQGDAPQAGAVDLAHHRHHPAVIEAAVGAQEDARPARLAAARRRSAAAGRRAPRLGDRARRR